MAEVESGKKPEPETEQESESESESERGTRYLNEEDYEEDEDGWHEMTPQEAEEYYGRLAASEGFDVPYLHKVLTCGNIAQVDLYSFSGMQVEKCAKFALEEHNKENGTNYKFYDVVKANEGPCAGVTFYITFEAEDLNSKPKDGGSDTVTFGPYGGEIIEFEAEVFLHLPDEQRKQKMVVHKFRKKGSQTYLEEGVIKMSCLSC